MRMTKRLLALLMAAIMMFSLAACGGGSDSPTDEVNDATNESAADDTGVKVTYIMGLSDEFLSILADNMQSAAEENGLNLELTVANAQNDPSVQLQLVENAKEDGADAIIVNLVESGLAPEIVERAGDMKVVFVNREPTDLSILNDSVVFVGADETVGGYFQGEALAEYFNAQGKTDIKYVMLNGTAGLIHTDKRTASVLQALQDGGINATEAIAPMDCAYDRTKAMDKMETLTAAGLEYDCIISNNDAMALGAIQALEEAGVDPSTIPIVGIDCTADAAQALKDGKMLMTVFQDSAAQGSVSLLAVMNMLNGDAANANTEYATAEDNEYIIVIPFESVTASTVDNYL